jgi:hypothetical protein
MSEDREKMERFGRAGREWAEKWSWESATSVLRNLQYPLAIQVFSSTLESKPFPCPLAVKAKPRIFLLGVPVVTGDSKVQGR